MIWTAVWAMYLGIVRLLGMWLPFALGLTIYLGVLLAIRVKWGYEPGLKIACVTMLGLCLGFGCGVLEGITMGSTIYQHGYAILPLLGLLVGFAGFFFVHGVVLAVDWFDDLMRTKTPPER